MMAKPITDKFPESGISKRQNWQGIKGKEYSNTAQNDL